MKTTTRITFIVLNITYNAIRTVFKLLLLLHLISFRTRKTPEFPLCLWNEYECTVEKKSKLTRWISAYEKEKRKHENFFKTFAHQMMHAQIHVENQRETSQILQSSLNISSFSSNFLLVITINVQVQKFDSHSNRNSIWNANIYENFFLMKPLAFYAICSLFIRLRTLTYINRRALFVPLAIMNSCMISDDWHCDN